VRYRGAPLKATATIQAPAAAVRFARKLLKDDAREHFIALDLDSRHRAIAYSIVSIGTANQSLVHPLEVFQPAIQAGAGAVIVLHNHPSGDPTPSPEDHAVTRRLADTGELLGIRVLDHIVLATGGRYPAFVQITPALTK